jgi:hypothetical protein
MYHKLLPRGGACVAFFLGLLPLLLLVGTHTVEAFNNPLYFLCPTCDTYDEGDATAMDLWNDMSPALHTCN